MPEVPGQRLQVEPPAPAPSAPAPAPGSAGGTSAPSGWGRRGGRRVGVVPGLQRCPGPGPAWRRCSPRRASPPRRGRRSGRRARDSPTGRRRRPRARAAAPDDAGPAASRPCRPSSARRGSPARQLLQLGGEQLGHVQVVDPVGPGEWPWLGRSIRVTRCRSARPLAIVVQFLPWPNSPCTNTTCGPASPTVREASRSVRPCRRPRGDSTSVRHPASHQTFRRRTGHAPTGGPPPRDEGESHAGTAPPPRPAPPRAGRRPTTTRKRRRDARRPGDRTSRSPRCPPRVRGSACGCSPSPSGLPAPGAVWHAGLQAHVWVGAELPPELPLRPAAVHVRAVPRGRAQREAPAAARWPGR